jgi:hypothetical protein
MKAGWEEQSLPALSAHEKFVRSCTEFESGSTGMDSSAAGKHVRDSFA